MRIKKKRAVQTTLGKPRARSHERGRNLSKKENRKKITLEPFPRGSRERCFLLCQWSLSFFFCFFSWTAFAPWCTLLKNYLFFTFFLPPPLSRAYGDTLVYRSREKKRKILLLNVQGEGSLRMQYPSSEARWRSSRLNNFQTIHFFTSFHARARLHNLNTNEYIGEVEVYEHPHRIVSFVEELIQKKRNATEEEEQKERLG